MRQPVLGLAFGLQTLAAEKSIAYFMISFDLILAFMLALVTWGMVTLARALRALAVAVGEQTDVVTQLARHLGEATLTTDKQDSLP